jgi:hypothetical protein
MGVEFRIIRKDNKTIFDTGKHLADDMLEFVFSQEELLEYLILWQVNFWDKGADPVDALIVRDRLLDFTEGASINNLKIVGDTWWDGESPDCKDYSFTHDRYTDKEQVEEYRQALHKVGISEYMENPLEFFRNGHFPKGTQIIENNRRKELYW